MLVKITIIVNLLSKNKAKKSYIDAKGYQTSNLIEKIQTNETYVPNDVNNWERRKMVY